MHLETKESQKELLRYFLTEWKKKGGGKKINASQLVSSKFLRRKKKKKKKFNQPTNRTKDPLVQAP